MSIPVALIAVAAGAAVLCAWELVGLAPWPRVVVGMQRGIATAGASTTDDRLSAQVSARLLVLVATVAAVAGWLVAGVPGGLGLGALSPSAAVLWARRQRGRRREQGARDTPVVARAIADALDGGHAIHGAILSAARDGAVPGRAGVELQRLADALACGDRTDAAVGAWARRLDDPVVDTVAAALVLGHEAGGDLGRVLRDAARAGEAAARARIEAASATAQARATARMVAALPCGALALAEVVAPGYIGALLHNPISGLLVAAAISLQMTGAVLVRRLSRVTG